MKAKFIKIKKEEYPRLAELHIPVRTTQDDTKYVLWEDVHRAMRAHHMDGERFSELYGCQTQISAGPYAWDVEDVLERMMSGKLQGTQLVMD